MNLKKLKRCAIRILPVKLFFFLVFISFVDNANAYELPNFSGTSNTRSYQEQTLGKIFMLSVRHELPILYDPFVNQYIRDLGQHLAGYSNTPHQHFYFFVVKDGSINAFAGPDGNIAVNTDTILAAQSEGELASVLAHEMAHVTQQHIMRSIAAQKRQQLPNMAAMLGAMVLGGVNPQVASGVMGAATAGSVQGSINKTRAHEEEADRIGMQTLKRAGYSSEDMATFFKRLQAEHQYDQFEGIPEEAYTHPFPSTRLAEVLLRDDHKKATKANLNFLLIQARSAVLSATNTSSIYRGYQKELKSHPNNIALQYAVAYSALKDNRSKVALPLFESLNQKFPDNALIESGLAETYQKNHQTNKALNLLKESYHYEPDNTALLLTYANILLQSKQYQAASRLLFPHYVDLKNDIAYLNLLSEAQGRSRQLSLAHQHRARLFSLEGKFPSAITQIQQAIRYEKSSAVKKRLQSQLVEYKDEQKALQSFSL